MSTAFKDIELGLIITCPLNPRKHGFDGPKFNELVASIRQKGVIEPIIVRPIKYKAGTKDPVYEIVAGERRYRAAGACGLKTIPAVVRGLTDDEAYDFMLIENLHREDLTELEEAESFKAYMGRHNHAAMTALVSFAEKTGIRPAYIRARIAVLALPKDVLAMWKDGKISYGHCAQLLRVSDPDVRGGLIRRLKAKDNYRKIETAAELKHEIDNLQIPLSAAQFPMKIECVGCRDNSTVQADLFGAEAGTASCLKPKCFAGKQMAWLKAHWKETKFHKDFKTNGVAIVDEYHYSSAVKAFGEYSFSANPLAKCFNCKKFITALTIKGKVESKQACVDPACFAALKKSKSSSSRKTGAKKPGESRCGWHGEYFRDKFYRSKIEAKVAELEPASPKGLAVLVALAVKTFRGGGGVGSEIGGLLGLKKDKYGSYYNADTVFSGILASTPEKLTELARALAKEIIDEGQSVGSGGTFSGIGMTNRAAVGVVLGIDLAKEFSVTEEYLTKKTRSELLAFGKKSGIFSDPKVTAHLARTIKKSSVNVVAADFDTLKKSELVDVFLKSGVNLVGKVPAEVLAK